MLGKFLVAWTLLLAPLAGGREHSGSAHSINDQDAIRRLEHNPGLADYIELAILRNRGLTSARLEWDASMERAPQARALPNPTLSYGHFIQSVETRVGPQERRLGLAQKFPWFGTLRLRGKMAEAEAEAVYQQYQHARLQVMRNVSVAYAEYYYLGSAIQLMESNITLLTGWEDILRSRYTTGGVTYSDLIKVQVELGKLQDALTTLQQQKYPRMSRLGSILDLPPGTSLPFPQSLPDPEVLEDVQLLRDALLGGNRELQGLQALLGREELREDLAGKQSYPTISLGLDWVHIGETEMTTAGAGRDALQAKVALELPLWRGALGAGTREAKALHRAADENLANRQGELLSLLDDLVFRHQDALRKVELYRDSLIPKGNQSLQAAFAAFQSGEGDFLSVLDSERALLEFGLSLERSRADLVEAKTHLDVLIGHVPERGAK